MTDQLPGSEQLFPEHGVLAQPITTEEKCGDAARALVVCGRRVYNSSMQHPVGNEETCTFCTKYIHNRCIIGALASYYVFIEDTRI